MNHMSKVMMIILLERLKPQLEPYLSEEQKGQKYSSANSDTETVGRKVVGKRKQSLQLFCRLPEGI